MPLIPVSSDLSARYEIPVLAIVRHEDDRQQRQSRLDQAAFVTATIGYEYQSERFRRLAAQHEELGEAGEGREARHAERHGRSWPCSKSGAWRCQPKRASGSSPAPIWLDSMPGYGTPSRPKALTTSSVRKFQPYLVDSTLFVGHRGRLRAAHPFRGPVFARAARARIRRRGDRHRLSRLTR